MKNRDFEPQEPKFYTWLVCMVASRVHIVIAKSQKKGNLDPFSIFGPCGCQCHMHPKFPMPEKLGCGLF